MHVLNATPAMHSPPCWMIHWWWGCWPQPESTVMARTHLVGGRIAAGHAPERYSTSSQLSYKTWPWKCQHLGPDVSSAQPSPAQPPANPNHNSATATSRGATWPMGHWHLPPLPHAGMQAPRGMRGAAHPRAHHEGRMPQLKGSSQKT
jgi:hypothetical protein